MARIVALDYGQRRIGVATTDASQCLSLPYKTLETKKKLLDTAKAVYQELKTLLPIEKIVLGLPLEMSGKEGVMAQEVRKFAEELAKETDIPLVFWDERLTSMQVEKSLKSLDYNRKKRAQLSDTAAACIILESYLTASKR